MKRMVWKILAMLSFAWAFPQTISAQDSSSLSLEAFLGQVKSRHAGIQASGHVMESANLKSDEAGLMFSPNFFTNVQHTDDANPLTNQSMRSKKTMMDSLSLGVKENFRTGTSGTLSYNLIKYEYDGITKPALPDNLAALAALFNSLPSKYYVEKPMVELRQSLWRNWLGREYKAAEEAARTRLESSYYSEKFKTKDSLLEAENSYFRLSFAREVVRMNQDNLQRAVKLKNWTAIRVGRDLADKTDLISADAMVNLRTLELRSAMDDERIASRNFNTLRGMSSDMVRERLMPFKADMIEGIAPPARADERDDVKALHASALAASAAASSSEEKNKPTLEAFGSYAMNSLNDKESKILPNALKTDQPTWVVGLSFSTPLDFDTIRRANSGYRLEALAAEEIYQRKKFEKDQEWRNLLAKLGEAKKRLHLAEEIEKVQKSKLENERIRNQRGRSTLYQVISAEQDYASAQQSKLMRINEVLQVAAQMKTYAGP
ncbi:MAG: TolC family protein [Oligoflexales bacterium]|nr:TolC family protein [Oligoflexales bacterium]